MTAEVIITMPAYKAESTVAKTVADIPSHLADRIILVDDASPDDTVRVARELGLNVVVHPENRGYGGNQKTCYGEALAAGADVVVMLHPDYQYDPKAVPLLIAPILAGDAEMTFGSRFAGLGDPLAGGMPRYRFYGNRLTTIAENVMLGARFTDMHSGMRAYTRKCLLTLPFLSYSDDFVFDTQFLVDAVTSGLRVIEVPIHTRYTKESSSIDVGRSLRYIAGSLAYTSRRSAERGRRGRRWIVATPGREKGASLGGGPDVDYPCDLCGGTRQRLIYPATRTQPSPDDFNCSARAGAHDDILQCVVCGLVRSRLTLSPAEILERYSKSEDPMYLTEEDSRRRLFEWALRSIESYYSGGRRLLELGASTGLFLDVAQAKGWDAAGIEPSAWAVREGVSRHGVDLREGTLEDIPHEERYDVVAMFDVLEHLVDPIGTLRTVRTHLADGGLVALTTVNLASVHARARGADWPWLMRSHLWYFTPQTLAAMLAKAGYRLIDWERVPRSLHLSYISHRLGAARPSGRILGAAAELADPEVPVGWVGDVVFALARPDPALTT